MPRASPATIRLLVLLSDARELLWPCGQHPWDGDGAQQGYNHRSDSRLFYVAAFGNNEANHARKQPN